MVTRILASPPQCDRVDVRTDRRTGDPVEDQTDGQRTVPDADVGDSCHWPMVQGNAQQQFGPVIEPLGGEHAIVG